MATVTQSRRKRARLHQAHGAQPPVDACLVSGEAISHATTSSVRTTKRLQAELRSSRMGEAGKAVGRTGARGLNGPQARTGPANEVQRRSGATAVDRRTPSRRLCA